MIDQTQRKAYGLIFFTFFIWGSVYVAGKIASTSMPSFLVAALRSVISMVPLWALSRKYLPVRIEREDWKWFLLIGFLGYFFCIHSIQLGIQLTGASMASLVNALTPVAVTILAALILKEKITPVKILCLILALAGTFIITKGASTRSETTGIIIVLLGMTGFAAASVFMRRLTAKYPPVFVTAVSMTISVFLNIPVADNRAGVIGDAHHREPGRKEKGFVHVQCADQLLCHDVAAAVPGYNHRVKPLV